MTSRTTLTEHPTLAATRAAFLAAQDGDVGPFDAMLPADFVMINHDNGVPAELRVIDGKDIMPLLTSDAPSPHDGLLAMTGPRVMAVRSGKWKLHVHAPGHWPTSIIEAPASSPAGT